MNMIKQLGFLGVALLAAGSGCKKSGGGGGWLVGKSALMANIDATGKLGAGYQLDVSADLNQIACRYIGEAWVVGDAGTLLYTNDSGTTWTHASVPTTADLRALATQNSGPVFIGGEGVFLTSSDTGAHWTSVTTTASIRAIAAAQWAETVLAIGSAGEILSFEHGALVQRTVIAGAHGLAISPDGDIAMIAAADGLYVSTDGGHAFTKLDASGSFDDVRIGEDGNAVAVGAAGAIASVDAQRHVSVQHVGTVDLHTVHIPDPDSLDATGYAAGEGGEVLVTHDSGATWSIGPNLGRTVLGMDEIGDYHN
jgi:photosystem II stability/assembly factor-like uncharacterized protein